MASETITPPGLVQQRWTFNATLDGLFLHLPGRVHVRYDQAANASAVVTASATSSDLLALVFASVGNRSLDTHIEIDGVELPVPGPHPVLNITTGHPDHVTRGALLVDVVLSAPVTYLSTHAETIVDAGVLATGDATAALELRAFDAGAIFYTDTTGVRVQSLKLDASDAATIQIASPSVVVETKLSIDADDSSRIALTANTTSAATLKVSASDAGAIYLHSDVRVDKLQTSADDASVVSVYPSGSCSTSKVDADDLGAVYIGSIVCVDSYASAADAGRVVLQTTGILHASTDDGGAVAYFNSTPAQLPKTRRPHKWFRFDSPNVHETTTNEYATTKLLPTPRAEPVAIVFTPLVHGWSWSWGGWTALDAAPTAVSASMEATSFVACAALVLLAAFVAVKRVARGRYQRIQ